MEDRARASYLNIFYSQHLYLPVDILYTRAYGAEERVGMIRSIS